MHLSTHSFVVSFPVSSLPSLPSFLPERGSLQRGVPLCEDVVPLARHFSAKDLTAATSPGQHGRVR